MTRAPAVIVLSVALLFGCAQQAEADRHSEILDLCASAQSAGDVTEIMKRTTLSDLVALAEQCDDAMSPAMQQTVADTWNTARTDADTAQLWSERCYGIESGEDAIAAVGQMTVHEAARGAMEGCVEVLPAGPANAVAQWMLTNRPPVG